MKKSEQIRQRLKDSNTKFWAGDNISEHLEEGDKQALIEEATVAFENVLQSLVIDTIDKKAYLSALSLAKYIAVTCDSTSMISEAALTGKPIYVADIPTKKNDQRFQKFKKLFHQLNIIKKLDTKLETWDYEILDETSRVAKEIKKKLI